jgi:hypothetical protein
MNVWPTYSVFENPFLNLIFDRTSTKEIAKTVKALKSKNSSGYDEISLKILKISSRMGVSNQIVYENYFILYLGIYF